MRRLSIRVKILMLCLALSLWAGIRITEADTARFIARIPTADEEARYVWGLLQRISFYNNNRYTISLPESPVFRELLERANRNGLKGHDQMLLRTDFNERVYKRSDYLKSFQLVEKALPTANEKINVFRNYRKKWNFYIPDRNDIVLTLYGPGGSYNARNGTIVLRAAKGGAFKRDGSPLGTILHEAVHIGIEEAIVSRYKLSHWEKERIVDQFVMHHFKDVCPNYRMQPISDTGIDEIFRNDDAWDNLPERVGQYISRKKRAGREGMDLRVPWPAGMKAAYAF